MLGAYTPSANLRRRLWPRARRERVATTGTANVAVVIDDIWLRVDAILQEINPQDLSDLIEQLELREFSDELIMAIVDYWEENFVEEVEEHLKET